MAGIDQLKLPILSDDEIATELIKIVAMRIAGFLSAKPSCEIKPTRFQVAGTPVRALQSISVVDFTLAIEQDGEMVTVLAHPFLNGGECPKRDDDDARIAFFEFFLVLAQLCHMLAAGNSAKVTQENEQDVVIRFE